jgi:hypothetical protein
VDPVPGPPLLGKSGSAGNRTRASGSVARNYATVCRIKKQKKRSQLQSHNNNNNNNNSVIQYCIRACEQIRAQHSQRASERISRRIHSKRRMLSRAHNLVQRIVFSDMHRSRRFIYTNSLPQKPLSPTVPSFPFAVLTICVVNRFLYDYGNLQSTFPVPYWASLLLAMPLHPSYRRFRLPSIARGPYI